MLAGLMAGTIGLARAGAEPSGKPWNFLVILLDDAGWKDLGFTGNSFAETPNMDRLAAQGMRFSTAYSAHPFCAPSRQSLMTGQWPARTAWTQRSELKNPDAPRSAPPFSAYGAPAWSKRDLEFTSLAEALKSKGYATGHFGKWHFGEIGDMVTPESEGFEVNFGGGQRVGAVKNFFSPYEGLPGNVASKPGEYLTDRLTDETIQFIRQNKDRPFYVQLWHYAPHAPLMAPEAVVSKYRKKREQLGDGSLNPTYAAMIDCVDRGVGRILQTLENLGLRDNTVILLTSDNGAQTTLGSVPVTSVAPLRGQKEYLYDGGVREPMAIIWPGHTRAGTKSDLPVSLIDFYPTILDIAGATLPTNQPVDGVSLIPLLNSGDQPELRERPLFWYEVKSVSAEDGSLILPGEAVRKGAWKLIKFFGHPLELYNLETDPAEAKNLAALEPERVKMLEALADEWLAGTGIAQPQPNPAYNPDYVIPRQIENTELPENAKEIRSWNFSSGFGKWKTIRMIKAEVKNGSLQMHSDGTYPEILTTDVSGLPAGVYFVQAEFRVATSGRIRFAWKDQSGKNGTVEFFPQRDGEWHTYTAVFQSDAPLQELRLAAPTHLKETGHYDPATQPDYIEVRKIRLISLRTR
jgi:arylsulfatase A-like enzyme